MEWSTIRVSKKTKEMLEELRLHPEESYEKVLQRIIKFVMVNKKEFLKWLGLPEDALEYYKRVLKEIDEKVK